MNKLSGFIDSLLQPGRGFSGLTTYLGVAVAGNLLAAVVGVILHDSLCGLVISALTIFVLLWLLYVIRRRSKPVVLVPENEQPPKHKGLIVLVGIGRPTVGEDPKDQSAWKAIAYHLSGEPGQRLRKCWLIASGGERGSLPNAQDIQTWCREQHLDAEIRTVADHLDVQGTYDVVKMIYESDAPKAKLSEEEVIADFTGGTHPMAAGMVLACGAGRPMQYMFGHKPGIASIPRLIKFKPQD